MLLLRLRLPSPCSCHLFLVPFLSLQSTFCVLWPGNKPEIKTKKEGEGGLGCFFVLAFWSFSRVSNHREVKRDFPPLFPPYPLSSNLFFCQISSFPSLDLEGDSDWVLRFWEGKLRKMKSPLRKLRGFALHWHDAKEKREHYHPPARLDELVPATQVTIFFLPKIFALIFFLVIWSPFLEIGDKNGIFRVCLFPARSNSGFHFNLFDAIFLSSRCWGPGGPGSVGIL